METTQSSSIKRFFKLITRIAKGAPVGPSYRVISVEENEEGHYEATVQLVGKGLAYRMKPEEILADDKLTDQFSSRDIRTLTYLGYLGINSPKYRILAQRLAEDDRMIFMLHKKGSKGIEMKTADDLSKDAEILRQMHQKDAHMVGFITANEQSAAEKQMKERLLSGNHNPEIDLIQNAH